MNFTLTEKERAFKQECEDFFKKEMKNAPLVFQKRTRFDAMLEEEEGWKFHKYMQKKLAEKGWIARAWPKEYGGQEASLVEQLIFNEVRSYYRSPGIDLWGVGMFAPTLFVAASEEQKKRLLPPIAKGEVHYCQGWSEPNAGSDLAALQTKAIKDGDHYIVNGQKTWSTGAHRADQIFLLLRTDPKSKGNAGLSVFCARTDLPGMEIRPIHYMNRRCIFDEIFFNDVKSLGSRSDRTRGGGMEAQPGDDELREVRRRQVFRIETLSGNISEVRKEHQEGWASAERESPGATEDRQTVHRYRGRSDFGL